MGADGVETQVGDQLAAPTHSGVVEFDNDSYKEADTVVVTLTDADLNTNPDIINIYTVVSTVQSVYLAAITTISIRPWSVKSAYGQTPLVITMQMC